MVYSQRLLLYADILGWSAATGGGQPEALLAAIQEIQVYAQQYSERARADLRREEKESQAIKINPMHLEVQFGAFSDHFVFSMPESYGSRILTTASKLAINLLRKGFLTRGAIVLGDLYHLDNAIFGPALIEAVAMEEEEAFYPRILMSGVAAARVANEDGATGWDRIMITDQTGRSVVNPFPVLFDVKSGSGEEDIMQSYVDLNLFFNEIKPILGENITSLDEAGRHKQAEKWSYLRDLIEGPVFSTAPALKKYWATARAPVEVC